MHRTTTSTEFSQVTGDIEQEGDNEEGDNEDAEHNSDEEDNDDEQD